MPKPPSRAVSLPALVPASPSRRAVLRGGLGLPFLGLFAGCGDDESGVDGGVVGS